MRARLWYRALLWAFPAPLRQRHGYDMEQLFADRCREARAGVSSWRGAARVVGLWFLALRDATVHGLGARLRPRRHGAAAAGGGAGGGNRPAKGGGRAPSFLAAIPYELRHAARSLRAAPAFTGVALVSLALGIGASCTIFTLINAVMLRPLPVAAPQQLVRVTLADTGASTTSFTNPQWEALRDHQRVFDGVLAVGTAFFDVGVEDDAQRTRGAWVSGGFFTTLGLSPAVGRLLEPADDQRGCPGVAVLGNGFWQRRFGGDPEVVGSTLLLSGKPFQIIGVARPGFDGLTVERTTEIYAPLCSEALLRGERSVLDARRNWFLRVVARVPPALAPQRLRAELAALAPAVLQDSLPDTWGPAEQAEYLGGSIELTSAATGFSGLRNDYRRSLLVLLGAVGVVMLVVCGNLANLLLARATRRRREIAMRVALGAGRGRVLAQFLSESLLLAGLGAAAGWLLSYWGSRALVVLISPPDATLSLDLQPDLRVLAFASLLTIVTGVLFGLAPALHALRVQPYTAMRGAVTGGGSLRGGGALVAAQVTLSLILLTGASLLVGTFWHLQTLNPGFDREGVMVVEADFRRSGLEKEQRQQVFTGVVERLRLLPGVRAASFSEVVPVSGSWVTQFVVASGFESLLDEGVEVFVHRVGDGYFASMGAPVLRGRDIAVTDVAGSEPVAVISETMAAALFDGGEAVGRTIHRRLNDTEIGEPIRVVGVVRDAKYRSLRDDPLPIMYVALRQQPWFGNYDAMTFQVLADGNAASIAASVRGAVADSAPRARASTAMLSEQLSASLARERLLALISAFFGGLTLFLAVIGLHGVMSFNVSRRFPEIGVRLALGSSSQGVFGLVLRQAARPVVAGLVLGTVGSVAAMGTLASMLYGLAPYEPRAFVFAAVVLAVAAMMSAALPARRAARLDPAVVLRQDVG